MAKIPRPLIGRHLTSVVLTPQAVAADGTLSDSTPVVTLATTLPSPSNVARNLHLGGDPELVEINAANTFQRNMVPVSDGWSLTLEVFKVNNGTDTNALLAAMGVVGGASTVVTEVFKAVWIEGTATGSISTCTFYGTRGAFSTAMQGRGEQIAELQLMPVDPGAPTVQQFSRVVT